jgi:DNA-binding MarR family transcriptional regulator
LPNQEKTPSEESARLRAIVDKLSRQLRLTVASSGLTPSQTSVLFTVVRKGPLGLTELADIEGINPTMLSRITGELCKRGLIIRRSDPEDKRAAFVQATASGRRTRERAHRERAQALDEHLGGLGEEHRRALRDALPALEELVDQIKGSRQ